MGSSFSERTDIQHWRQVPWSSLVEILRQRAAMTPDRMAFTFLKDGETPVDRITDAELDREARSIAAWLQARNLAGERVLLPYPPGIDFIRGLMGCLYAGAIAVPMYPPHPHRVDERLLTIARDARARAVLCVSASQARLEAFLDGAAGDVLATDTLPDGSAGWTPHSPQRTDPAFLQYTSGSTGTPRGVIVGHGNILHNAWYITALSHGDFEPVLVTWQPFFHDMGLIGSLVYPIYNAVPTWLMAPAAFLQKPIRWLRAAARYGATHIASPNFGFDLSVSGTTPAEREGLDLSTLRCLWNGAEPVRAETLRRFTETFAPHGFVHTAHLPCYGMAETTLCVSATPPETPPVVAAFHAEGLERHQAEPCTPETEGAAVLAGSGQIGGGFDVRIVAPDTQTVCSPDAIGEIWVAGPSIAQGYWERPEDTARTFGARLADDPEAGPFLRTGDLGFLHNGELFVTGRLKDLIIIRGRNVYPQDLERAVEQCHPVLELDTCAAFACEVDGQETLALAVEIKRTERRRADPEEIFEQIRAALGERFDLAPHWIVLLGFNKMPKTSSGKIMRSACRERLLAGEIPMVAEWRRGATGAPPAATAAAPAPIAWNAELRGTAPDERRRRIVAFLRQELATRLGLGALPDPRQGFEKIGVDSMMAVELVKALETWLGAGVELPATLLFDQPNIEAVARYLDTLDTGAEALPPRAPVVGAEGVALHEPVAVVGLACRFPGAADRDAFWTLLDEGRDAIREVPPDRWDLAAFFDPDPQAYGRMYTKVGGFIDDYAGFDAAFFDISPREALSMDPQQRIILETAWTALEDAGIAPGGLEGLPVGVFLGVSTGDYRQALLNPAAVRDESMMATGTATCGVAGRLSYTLGLRGPCLVIDTACSSSVVAIHQAMQSLRLGESQLALAGGVNLVLSPEVTVSFCRAGMLAPDGRCKTFDAAADGYSRGEGCGVLVLKRLRDAQRDGDRILAVFRGSAVNQDGRSSGLTAPSGPAQSEVIARALNAAGVAPAQVQYLETHGTGTPLGDPIEVQAADAVYARDRAPDRPLLIGSVKTNLGHLEAAAGVAGVIKVILALRHRRLPASLNFQTPNPHIRWEKHAVRVVDQAQPWPEPPPGARPLAAVSSFGFVGTNAHLIVEAAPEATDAPVPPSPSTPALPREHYLLTLSARTPPALDALLARYAAWLELPWTTPPSPADLCRTANLGRSPQEQRAAFVFKDLAQLQAQFQAQLTPPTEGKPPAGAVRGTVGREPRRVAFLFTGQGAQYAGMGRELYAAEPVFRECIDHCAAAYAELGLADGEPGLTDLLFAPECADRLRETLYAQPAIYALQVALAAQWRAWGIAPAALLGHSLGEYAAAAVSGAFSIEAGMKLVRKRAQLMQTLPPGGAMASVTAPPETVEAALTDLPDVCVSAYNGLNTVISGPAETLDTLLERFDRDGLYAMRLPATAAFHSAAVDPMLADFEAYAATLPHGVTGSGLISSLTGTRLEPGLRLGPEHWRDHARRPVRFAQGVRVLFEEAECDVVLEIGPKAELMWLAQMCWRPEREVLWLSALEERRHAHAHMLTTAARLHVAGATLDMAALEAPWRTGGRKLDLPTYPFQHQRFWPEGIATKAQPAREDDPLEVVWQPRPAAGPTNAIPHGRWLLLADDRPAGAALAERLRLAGHTVVVLRAMDLAAPTREATAAGIADALASSRFDHVVLLWSPALPFDADAAALARAQVLGVIAALAATQSLIHQGHESKIWIVTQGAQPVTPEDPVDPSQSPLWGFARTLGLEHPDRLGAVIDLPHKPTGPDGASTTDADGLARVLLDPERPRQAAVRDGQCWVPRLQRLDSKRLQAFASMPVSAEGAYLITGGTGALGQEVAEHLAARGAGLIILAGRRGPQAVPAEWQARLTAQGCRLETIAADVARPGDAERLLGAIGRLASDLPLRGIVHAAGLLQGEPIQSMSPETLEAVLDAKVAGSWHLHRASTARGLPLEFFVLFSSAASLLGLRGHGNYSAANAFLDGLAHHRRRLGLPVVSINWGPWAKRGMATQIDAAEWEAMGTRLMDPDDALRALDQYGAGGVAEVFVQRMNLDRWGTLAATGLLPPVLWEFMADILPAESMATSERMPAGGPVPAGDGPLVQRLRPLARDAQHAGLRDAVRGEVGAVLGIAPESLDPDTGFFDSGMNSIMAVELSNRLQSQIGGAMALRPAAIFNHPTVNGMTDHLASTLFGDAPDAATPAAMIAADRPDFSALSTEELAAALDQAIGRTPAGTAGQAAPSTPQDADRLRGALEHLAALRHEMARLKDRIDGPIAVVGLACRVPGAENADAFWRLLEEGRDAIREVPPDRWDASALYDPDPDAPGKISTRQGGFLDHIDRFDADFFGISPREARSLDPQQRLLLETAWQALEHANHAPDRLRGSRGGVFVGITVSDYGQRLAAQGADQLDAYVGTGNALSAAAGRIAFKLGWFGPALAIDTACSSSLVAIHEACACLRRGECDQALAGGVNVLLSPEVVVALSRAHMLSPDGRCKTFDAAADGFGRGEGCGLVVLKRLADAERDGDRVLAVIRGSAVNQDGNSSGLTVPNGVSQMQLLRQALAQAGRAPADLQYLECHGTGTSLGDPIEVQAADAVYSVGRAAETPLLIGSVKSNIGHLESAAGAVGLIKLVLAMQHGRIPQSLHFRQPNPHIPWDALKVRVVDQPLPWPEGPLRIAGISSFGFAGTNAHVLLEAPAVPDVMAAASSPSPPERDRRLLALSAQSAPALHALAGAWMEWLTPTTETELANACHSANIGRSHLDQRAGLVFTDAAELRAQLSALSQGQSADGLFSGALERRQSRRRVGFLFTGQGAQYVGMGRALYATEAVFRETLDRCAAVFDATRDAAHALPLLDVMGITGDDAAADESQLHQTGYTQPALYALEVALAALWRDWGVVPEAVLGHSVGEYAAAAVAGVFTVEDGMRLIAERARLMQSLPAGGAMVSIDGDAARITAVLADIPGVDVAAANGAGTVISGTEDAVAAAVTRLTAEGMRAKALKTSHAFHSSLMDSILEPFKTFASGFTFGAPDRILISNVSGAAVTEANPLDAAYWSRHIRQPVRFADGVRAMRAAGLDVLIEVGPHPVLVGMGQRCADPEPADGKVLRDPLWLGSLRRGRPETQTLLGAAAQLHVAGVPVDLAALDAPWRPHRRNIALPLYPFQRQSYWLEGDPKPRASAPPKVPDCLYRVFWEALTPVPAPSTHVPRATWLIVPDAGGLAGVLRERLEARGQRVLIAPAESTAETIAHFSAALTEAAAAPDAPFGRVLYLRALDRVRADDFSALREAQACGVGGVVARMPALLQQPPGVALWIVTQGAQPVRSDDCVEPAQSPLWGLGRVLALEHPEIWGGLIDLPAAGDPAALAGALAERLLTAEGNHPGEDQLALRDNQCWVARLDHSPLPPESAPLAVSPEGTYLITGGLGAIGLKIAQRLADRGARHLVLVGRRAPTDDARTVITALEGQGCSVRIVAADIADEADATRVMDLCQAPDHPPLAGIVHTAGVAGIQPLANLDTPTLDEALAAKVYGAWLLDRLAAERGLALDLFVCTSSAAAVWGSMGQAAYAAANAFLGALAHQRVARGQKACTIDYGPWGGLGMMAATSEAARAWIRAHGIEPFSADLALDGLETLAGAGMAQTTFARVNWATMARALADEERHPPLLARLLAPHQSAAAADARPEWRIVLDALPPVERPPRLLALVRAEVAQVLRIPAADLHDDASFFTLGMDSLMAVELANRLKRGLGQRGLAAQLVYDHPTLNELVAILLSAIAQGPETVTAVAATPHPAAPGPREYPATVGQTRIAFLQQWAPESPQFHMPMAMRFHQGINPDRLQRVLQEILRRHDALRTQLVPGPDGALRQVVSPDAALVIEGLDFSADADPGARLAERAIYEARRLFDLQHGPLIRFTLARLGAADQALIVNMHHAISDGISVRVLLDEFLALHDALAAGIDLATLPPPPARFGDYARTEAQRLAMPAVAADVAYWRETLRGIPPLELPADHPRPAVFSHAGDAVPVNIPAALRQQVVAFSRAAGVTPYITLLAGWALLLSRYAHQEDFGIGTPVAGREGPEWRGVIGFFLNMLTLRVRLQTAWTGHDLIAHVQALTREAYAHQTLPFDWLVQQLNPARDPSRAPLFQTALILEVPRHDLRERLDGAGITVEDLRPRLGSAQFDLTLDLVDADSGFHGFLEYRTDLFARERIVRMAAHYETLLQALVSHPETPLAELPLLAPAERAHVLTAWNDSRRDYPLETTLPVHIAARAPAPAGRSRRLRRPPADLSRPGPPIEPAGPYPASDGRRTGDPGGPVRRSLHGHGGGHAGHHEGGWRLCAP